MIEDITWIERNEDVDCDMNKEVWRDARDWEDILMVSNYGRVWKKPYTKTTPTGQIREHKGQYIPRRMDNHGYESITFRTPDGREHAIRVMRLVAKTFISNPDPVHKTDVGHLNEDRMCSRADNLMWMTRSENINYGNCRKVASDHRWKQCVLITDLDGRFSSFNLNLKTAAESEGLSRNRATGRINFGVKDDTHKFFWCPIEIADKAWEIINRNKGKYTDELEELISPVLA